MAAATKVHIRDRIMEPLGWTNLPLLLGPEGEAFAFRTWIFTTGLKRSATDENGDRAVGDHPQRLAPQD